MTNTARYVLVSFVSAAATSAAPSLSQRLGLILAGLRRDVAFRAARDRAVAALLLVLWNRLSRTLSRFAAIADRYGAGTLRTPPKAPNRPASAPPSPRDLLPRQSGWLVRRIPDCAVYGEYLDLLLAEPEMAEMIEAAPQLRRLLRPLWRMLRTDKVPQALRPPPAVQSAPRRPARGKRQSPLRAPSSPRAAPRVRPLVPLTRRPLNRA